ncbi:hypothetical protein F5876DRAFT_72609 [Lentinula aff. lateritia]|uniref:Uncharacterized protein n=1 Tax=Lentinula aff. lateritia TaxID=2804960 RepID=A0ACC1UCU0_9AGAR|nr:hypothetical protein F5876DRAFT_72609 [Lentinula aff. lateritia]
MSTFHQLMTFDQSSTNFTQPPIPTAGPATEPDGPRSFAFVPTLGILVPHPPPPVIQVQRQDTLGQDPANAIVDGSGSLVGNFNTGAGANHYPSSAGVPRLPPILQVEKQQVTTSATQLAKASSGFFGNLFPDIHLIRIPMQAIFGPIRKSDRLFVNGLDVIKALLASMIASAIKHFIPANLSRMFAKDARRLLRHLRSDGGAECRAKHTMKAASADQSGPSQLPPAILHIPLQTAQSPPQVPPKLQVPP